jgi:aspartate ammonia-lyase
MKKYYGKQTESAIQNFPFPVHSAALELIYSIAQVKKAAALAHKLTKELPSKITDAIAQASDEILAGKFDDQFKICAIQGGAGTSINMNVNEVIASRASEICGQPVHPNDHVNKSQSTNDVNPSAMKITTVKLTETLLENIDLLIKSFEEKAKEWKEIKKVGRTHIQDALPTTLGAEFKAYADIIKRDKSRIKETLPYLYDLNLGGTAVGNSINASEKYIEQVYKELNKITGLPLKKSDNFMVGTQSSTDFCQLSSTVNILFTDLHKIATDLRFLASGPYGGIGEIMIKPLQKGSSIMPGKVNPVLPEAINQIAYYIAGKNLTIHQASQNSHLELGIMFPVLADSLITILKLSASGVSVFALNCIQQLSANPQKCQEFLEKSTVYATLLVPKLGYDTVTEIVKEAIQTKRSIRELVIQKKLLTQAEFETLINRQIQ